MSNDHPNVEVLQRFDPTDVPNSLDVFAEDVVFHFYNPYLPELDGDHIGHDGILSFFQKLQVATGETFKPNIVSINTIGDELVVVHRKQEVNLDGQHLESDVVVVWRIVDDRISEVWDIPSIHSIRTQRDWYHQRSD